jgi:amidase
MDDLGALVPGSERLVDRAASGGGALAGTRLVVKDVIDVAGMVTGAGNPDWSATHEPAAADAAAVAAVIGAGAELLGKGQCSEFAYSLSGDNVHYGMPRNPAAPDHDPGGSTSGPASATGGDLCDLGIGTDTLGSIRIPASYCGVYGFRPTHGAVPVAGVLPLAQRFDTVGLLARDPAVLRRAAEALLGHRPRAGSARPRRLLVVAEALDAADPEVAEAVRGAAVRLGHALDAGVETTELLTDGAPDLEAAMQAFSVLQGAQVWRNFGPWIEATSPSMGDDIAARMEGAAKIAPEDMSRAEPVAAAIAALVRRLSATEALVIPATGTVAPHREADLATRQAARVAAGRLSCVGSLAGAPAVSLPLARAGNLPVGLSLVGATGSDHALLAAAVAGA